MKPEEPNLTARDKLLRDSFTPAEAQLCVQISIMTSVAFWLADPRSFWGLGFYMIGGGICLFILKTHEESHPFFIDTLWRKFWLYSTPVWFLILQSTIGLMQRPLVPIEIGAETYYTITPINAWLPVTTTSGATWVTVLSFCALYLASLNLYLVPKSRAFFEKVIPWLCFSAVLVCIFGYLQEAFNLQAPLFTKGTGQSDFFSYFPYDGHWAAFALIWCCVCTSMALLSSRYPDSPNFIHSISPWYLTGAGLLGASGFLVEAHWPSVILLIAYSGMLLLVALNYLVDTKDEHSKKIALTSGLLASSVFTAGIYRALQSNPLSESSKGLHQAAIEMFRDSPVFGWGMDSYQQLLPFYLDDTLLGARYERADSDVLQFLAEIGIVGTIVPVVILSILLFHYFKNKSDVRTTNYMLIGCLGVGIMAFFDTPFMSPAVFLSFFVVFFSALRWADLSRNRVDKVDAVERPALVTPVTERRIPFFTEEYTEQEK
ncbi:MAG: O-antigen ligase family protein [Lentimonas sp.]